MADLCLDAADWGFLVAQPSTLADAGIDAALAFGEAMTSRAGLEVFARNPGGAACQSEWSDFDADSDYYLVVGWFDEAR